MSEEITVGYIHDALRGLGGYRSIYIPEFTWGGLRVDAAVVDLETKWVRGFEVKVSRNDFVRDEKWMLYSQFCSSLSIVCPAGLIQKDEVQKPFGLLWIGKSQWGTPTVEWVRRPRRFQSRDGLAWLWMYMKVIEKELPRLEFENQKLRSDLKWYQEKQKAAV